MEMKAQAAVNMNEADATATVDQTDLRVEEAVTATASEVKVETRNIANTVTAAQGLERVVGKSANPDAPTENLAVLHASQWGLLLLEETLYKAVMAGTEVIVKAAAVVKTGRATVEEDEDNVREVYDQTIVVTGERTPVDERGGAKEIQGRRMIARNGPDDKDNLNESRHSMF